MKSLKAEVSNMFKKSMWTGSNNIVLKKQIYFTSCYLPEFQREHAPQDKVIGPETTKKLDEASAAALNI